MLFALMFAVGSVPIADATNIETENAKIVNEKGNLKVEPVKVEAAYKKTKYKKYKKTYRKKVRASYRTSVRKRYSSKYYKKKRVRAAYSTSTYHYSSIGDCWAMSEYLYKKLTASGEKVRIIQYATSMSPRHRTVQVYRNGGWVDYSYSGYNKIYWPTRSKPGMFVVKSSA
ncbi:MAG: hypothetical protein GX212_06855 [Methanothermobacter wolfeii]|uniref:hypothetical protein n=1 Tax=Methanothermobacter sp. DSM 3267 TaxID=3381696 RepID=UPI000942CDBB|nr:hypothetical protein [Methanothermobacter wolfeii]QHN07214.1 hypothetical protein FZP57_04340 [Methanothermobacter sp. THM-1]